MCVCVCVCVRACVRACVRVCVCVLGGRGDSCAIMVCYIRFCCYYLYSINHIVSLISLFSGFGVCEGSMSKPPPLHVFSSSTEGLLMYMSLQFELMLSKLYFHF